MVEHRFTILIIISFGELSIAIKCWKDTSKQWSEPYMKLLQNTALRLLTWRLEKMTTFTYWWAHRLNCRERILCAGWREFQHGNCSGNVRNYKPVTGRSRIVICGHRVTMLKASAQSMNRLLPSTLMTSVEKRWTWSEQSH